MARRNLDALFLIKKVLVGAGRVQSLLGIPANASRMSEKGDRALGTIRENRPDTEETFVGIQPFRNVGIHLAGKS